MPGFGFGAIGIARHRRGIAGPPAGSPLMAVGDRLVFAGDSMTYGNGDTPNAYMPWLTLLAEGRFNYPATVNKGSTNVSLPPEGGNMGVSGQNSNGYITRKANIAAACANGALILGGIENDFAGGLTAAQSIANFEEMIAACTTAKRIYITPGAPTKSVIGNAGNAAKKTTFDAYFAAHPDPRVKFLTNCWNGITLALDAINTGPHSYDAVHQNPLGAKLQAANIWSEIAADWAAGTAYADPALASGDLLGTAGLFAGTGGTANGYGQVATGWTLTNSTGAALAASVADNLIGDKRGQRLVASGTASANSRIRMRHTITNAYVTGDRVLVIGRLRVRNAAGDGPPIGLRAIGISALGGATRFLTEAYAGGQGPFAPVSQIDGIFRNFVGLATATGGSWTLDVDFQTVTGTALDIALDIADFRTFNLGTGI
ncbi:hypothetical protein [Sphingobium algorifonticola]|uniref:Uncharacterized protein n=1 Tax=Sphingobium algorifonticola TaxID=2008318 RepID=A0A437J582_9SPHN|nr:hypothetical protein [Sphingobium algorifonticola]RVT39909.1 hypothetical protein ENE74_14340 [Sphingobium algorifonticola]